MFQDDIFKKPNSLIAKNDLIIQTMINALVDKQLQPLFLLKKEKWDFFFYELFVRIETKKTK